MIVSEQERAQYEKMLNDVKELLTDEHTVQDIMREFDKNKESKEEFHQNREIQIKRLLAKAGHVSEEDYETYIKALTVSKKALT